MKNFIIEVLVAVVAAFIIFLIKKLGKYLLTIPMNTWQNIFFGILVLSIYLININNIVIFLKLLTNATTFSITYLVALATLSLCFYSSCNLSVFIRKYFFKK